MGINGSSANPKSAYMFAYFATSKEMDKIHWIKFVMPPARLSNFDDPEVKQVVPWFETYPLTMANLSNRPRIPQEPEMERVGNPMWQDILKTDNESSIRSKLDRLVNGWNSLAAQFKG
ncbi:hypothetical protein HRbin06_00796 [archaeon HR06]|nr:hypothetical protein HRbin06_00796 [archaeon HR06]